MVILNLIMPWLLKKLNCGNGRCYRLFQGHQNLCSHRRKPVFFRIKLLPKTIAGTIQAGSGGTVTLSNGLSIAFPSGGIKKML